MHDIVSNPVTHDIVSNPVTHDIVSNPVTHDIVSTFKLTSVYGNDAWVSANFNAFKATKTPYRKHIYLNVTKHKSHLGFNFLLWQRKW